MSRISNENYINISGWMVTELGLKGNELLVYAIIYGFSQAEEQVFGGSLQYLADWTNSTKQGVIKNLKALVEKGLLGKNEKILNGVRFCEYYVTKFNRECNSVEQGIKQSLIGGIKQSLPNILDIDNKEDNIKEKNIEKKKTPSERELSEEFETVWKKYPRREGKANAFKSYMKARKEGVPKGDIERGIERYIDNLKNRGTEAQYIKMGSSWFNQRGWEDEYIETCYRHWNDE